MGSDAPHPLDAIEVASEDGARIRLRRHGNLAGPRPFLSHGNGKG